MLGGGVDFVQLFVGVLAEGRFPRTARLLVRAVRVHASVTLSSSSVGIVRNHGTAGESLEGETHVDERWRRSTPRAGVGRGSKSEEMKMKRLIRQVAARAAGSYTEAMIHAVHQALPVGPGSWRPVSWWVACLHRCDFGPDHVQEER